MDVRLLVAHSKSEKKQIRLGVETLIGRSPECNLRIASGQVSRRHCLIKVDAELVLVRDLGSANGTRLNGQTIQSELDVAIPPGSTLVVGPLKFVVQFTPPRPARSPETDGAGRGMASTHDLAEMATVPVFDGEETKDYPPTCERKRGAPPPLMFSSELRALSQGGDGGHREAPTDAEAQPADETVFDLSLEDGDAGASGGSARPPIGSETGFLFEEDELAQLTAPGDADTDERPARPDAGAAATAERDGDLAGADEGGWRLLDMLRGKKTARAASDGAADPADDQLRKFLDNA